MKFRHRYLLVALVAALLAGCAGLGKPPKPYAIHDLGLLEPVTQQIGLPITLIKVTAPSWLASSAMQYRLDYRSESERNIYTENRWAAMPAEMVNLELSRALPLAPLDSGGGCLLHVSLDEFIQQFDRPDHSDAVIRSRIALIQNTSHLVVAERSLDVRQPAPTADAPGAARGFHDGVRQMAVQTAAWLDTLAEGRSSIDIKERCGR